MTDRNFDRPEGRPALQAGRLALRVFGVILAIPVWLLWLMVVLVLPFGRMFVQFPLTLAMFGSAGAGIYFALHHAWEDAFSAGGVGFIAGLLLAVFTYIGEQIDPEFSRPTPLPPWWWHY